MDATLWALGRGTGVSALVLLTVALLLGVLTRAGCPALYNCALGPGLGDHRSRINCRSFSGLLVLDHGLGRGDGFLICPRLRRGLSHLEHIGDEATDFASDVSHRTSEDRGDVADGVRSGLGQLLKGVLAAFVLPDHHATVPLGRRRHCSVDDSP